MASGPETNRTLSESFGSLLGVSIQTIARAGCQEPRNTLKLVQLTTTAAWLCAAAAAHALDVKACSAAALAEAQKADKSVAPYFRADGCPTCRVQDKLFDAMKAESGLGIAVLAVN